MVPIRPRILVAEDEVDVRDSIRTTLEDAGFEVQTVADGQEALQVLQKGPLPDLLVLDLKLPRRSGWELLEILRRSPTLLSIPVIVVSAYLGFPPTGAVRWIRKPFKGDELIDAVRDITS